MKTTSAPQDNIKKGLSSIDTCTSTVATLLHDTLFPKADRAGASSSSLKHARTKSTITKTKPATGASSSTGITDDQRNRIAVESLNSILQLLKDVTSQAGTTKQSKAKAGASKSNLDNVISCAQDSISYLNSKADCGLKPGTRESAHLNLINRLIQAGKLDVATEEVLSLKARVSNQNGKSKSLASVWEWDNIPEEPDMLVVAIGVQIGAMRIAATKPDAAALQVREECRAPSPR